MTHASRSQIWNAAGFSAQAPSVLTRPTRRAGNPEQNQKDLSGDLISAPTPLALSPSIFM